MAVDLVMLGIEATAAITVALVIILSLRGAVRAVFGARAAYCLWLLVPAMTLAVALPRIAAPAPLSVTVATALASTASAATPAPEGPAAPTFVEAAPALLPDPAGLALPLLATWLLGLALHAGLLVRRQRRFLSALGPVRAGQRSDGLVYYAARPDVGPALVGVLSPRIILPADFAERFSAPEQAVVVAHERIHLSGGDAQINLLAAAAQTIFWFHPLVHIASRLLRVDQELACDETVVARFPHARRHYAEAMLKTQMAASPAPLGCHWLAGGKRELRDRIARLNARTGRTKRIVGAGLATALASAGGMGAWAAQPARQEAPMARNADVASGRDLIGAIRDGRDETAATMILAGAEPDAAVFGEGSPLIIAVREGRQDLVRLMLEKGANPDRAVLGDGSPLISAAGAGDLPMVDLLLAHRANPDLPVHGDGSPLIAAAGRGHLEVVERLLAAGAAVDRVVPSDETALINAAGRGHLPVVQRLVEAGADVNLAVEAPRYGRPPERRSPLSAARRSGQSDIVAYLIAHGARA